MYLNKSPEVLLNSIKSESQHNHRIALPTLEGLLLEVYVIVFVVKAADPIPVSF